MAENRAENREPVSRAFCALPMETLVEVTERFLPDGGLCVHIHIACVMLSQSVNMTQPTERYTRLMLPLMRLFNKIMARDREMSFFADEFDRIVVTDMQQNGINSANVAEKISYLRTIQNENDSVYSMMRRMSILVGSSILLEKDYALLAGVELSPPAHVSPLEVLMRVNEGLIRTTLFCLEYFSRSEIEERARKKKAAREQRLKKEQEEASAREHEQQAKIAEREEKSRQRGIWWRQLRKEIEDMPLYRKWRNDVLALHGRKCAICPSTENIEVDHFNSLYSLVTKYNIENVHDVYEHQRVIFDVNNGFPLCRKCHSKRPSSQYYRKLNPA